LAAHHHEGYGEIVIVPTAAEILRSIEHTLEAVIRPALTGTAEQSAAAN
jgi:hypothetical protein